MFIVDQLSTEYFSGRDSINVLALNPTTGKRLIERTYFIDGNIITRFKVIRMSPELSTLKGANFIASFGLESDNLEWAIQVYNSI